MRYRLPAALATLALLLGACANASPGDGGDTPTPTGAISHPTDADQVLLKVSYEGGFVAPSTLATRLPTFALYGDGTILVPGAEDAIYPGPALPSIEARTVSEAGIQAILRAAIDAGLEHDGDYGDMGQMGVADAATTVFVLQADGKTHRVSAYALGMEGPQQPGQSDAMWRMRRALQHLVQQLGDLDTLVPAGSLGPRSHVRSDLGAPVRGALPARRPTPADPRRLAPRRPARRVRRPRTRHGRCQVWRGERRRLGRGAPARSSRPTS